MKIFIILFSTLLLTLTTYAANGKKEGGHSHDEVTTNGLSSGKVTDNIININVNGMVCDFCAQSIEKVFLKQAGVEKVDVNLDIGKVTVKMADVFQDDEDGISDERIKQLFLDAGYDVSKIERD